MKLDLKTTCKEEELIKAYLEANASETLAEKINHGVQIQKDGKMLINKKTLSGFMKFACDEAKKQAEKGARTACIEDNVVYGWAVHYFEEESIEEALFHQDGSAYKPERKETKAPKPSTAPIQPAKPAPPPKPQKMQLSLFDMAFGTYGAQEEQEPAEEEQATEEAPLIVDKETGEVLPENDVEDDVGEDLAEDDIDLTAYDSEALAALDELFGDEITLR